MAMESDEASSGPDEAKPVFDELAGQAEGRSLRLFDGRTSEDTHLVLLTGWHKKVLLLGSSAEGIRERLEEHACKVSSVDDVGMGVGFEGLTAPGPSSRPRYDRDRDDQAIEAAYASELQGLVSDERFDVVVLGDFLRHQAEPRLVLQAVKSVLSPKGSVVASLPNLAYGDVRLAVLAGEWPGLDSPEAGWALRADFFGRTGIEALLSAAGYRIQEWRGMEQDLFSAETGLRRQDYPGRLIEAVSRLSEARVAHFMIRAQPTQALSRHGEETEQGSVDGDSRRAARLEPLWDLELRAWALEKRLQEAQAQLDQSVTALAQLEQSQRQLIESSSHRLARRLERFVDEIAPPRTTRRRLVLGIVLAMRSRGRSTGQL